MLAHLRVRDLVLIESLDLPLAAGLNVLTGETGAGKSLVATAVGLLLGRKAGPEVVRRGAAEAEVEGLFDVTDEPWIQAKLEAAGLPGGDELLVRRIVPADGRQRCFVNGRLASLAVLADLAEGLASFSGQHEHLSLADPARQLRFLDDYAAHEALLAAMAAAHDDVRAAVERRDSLLGKEEDRARRFDWLQFQIQEIEALAPRADELDELVREAERLRHQELLLGAAGRAADGLYETDGSAYERISALAADLERAARHDEALAPAAEELVGAAEVVADCARRLRRYADALEAEPGRLDEVEDRRAALEALVKKHRTDLPGVLARLAEMKAEAAELADFEVAAGKAEAAVAKAREAARRAAEALSRARRAAAKKLSAAVSRELGDLALGAGGFEVRLTEVPGDPGPTGADRAEFLVVLNAGEGAHPMRKVASGGELSRLVLALRRAAAGVGRSRAALAPAAEPRRPAKGPLGTYVFDEVDAGIGGAVASAVGAKLKETAAHHQVLCITHLPQIAGLADAHFLVAKQEAKGRTAAEVRRLNEEERVQEIARMLGGAVQSETTRAAARELLSSAGRAAGAPAGPSGGSR